MDFEEIIELVLSNNEDDVDKIVDDLSDNFPKEGLIQEACGVEEYDPDVALELADVLIEELKRRGKDDNFINRVREEITMTFHIDFPTDLDQGYDDPVLETQLDRESSGVMKFKIAKSMKSNEKNEGGTRYHQIRARKLTSWEATLILLLRADPCLLEEVQELIRNQL